MIIGGQNIMCSESNNVFLSSTAAAATKSGTDFSIAAIMAKQNHCMNKSLKSESTDKNSSIDEITSDSEDNNSEVNPRSVSKSPSIDGDDRSTPDQKVGYYFAM